MYFCPFCGYALKPKLENGITTCVNCDRLFDSSPINRVLSAAWAIRRWHLDSIEVLREKCGVSLEDCDLLYQYAVEEQRNPHEIFKILMETS